MMVKADLEKPVPCPECQGSGLIGRGCNLFQCHACSGTGELKEKTDLDPDTSTPSTNNPSPDE